MPARLEDKKNKYYYIYVSDVGIHQCPSMESLVGVETIFRKNENSLLGNLYSNMEGIRSPTPNLSV